MQYFGRAIGSVSKTWNSINPATLSGAIDVIVVENEDGEMHCSPFHVRFGKFQLLRPSQKKVSFIVNGEVTDIPMKLNDEGEAFFVFETDGYVPEHLQTSPVVSAISSPNESPRMSPFTGSGDELEYLDIGEGVSDSNLLISSKKTSTNSDLVNRKNGSMSPIERAKSISMKLNIPSKVEANGDILLDMDGYKSDNKDIHDTDVLVKQLLQEEFGDDVDVQSMMNKDLEGNIRILNNNSTASNCDSEASDISTPFASIPPPSSISSNGLDDNNMNNKEKETVVTPPLPSIKSSTEDFENSEVSQQFPSSTSSPVTSPNPSFDSMDSELRTKKTDSSHKNQNDVHFKTLRLTSEQLKCLSLNDGENDITYSVNNGKSIVTCKLFLWKRNIPIVISDIDGTITRSDALGHVLTMLGRDWTHEGVAKLFDDIEFNGYNIMYLTARSVGLADMTRSYLQGVEQDGYKLPMGPVILSPDRTMAALKREVVLKKPEIFKMACLNDIRTLYYPDSINKTNESKDLLYDYQDSAYNNFEINNQEDNKLNETLGSDNNFEQNDSDDFTDINTNTDIYIKSGKYRENKINPIVDETNTPFYAGFGNKITDAISYRSVGVPSSRIFTINPDGDVKMELLEMAGYKCSYVSIVELVDQFFPPVEIKPIIVNKDEKMNFGGNTTTTTNNNSNDNNNGNNNNNGTGNRIKRNGGTMLMGNARNKYTDFNYWRSPDIDLSLISEDESENEFNDKKSNEIFNKGEKGIILENTENNNKVKSDNVNEIISNDGKNNPVLNKEIKDDKNDINDKDFKDEVKTAGSRFNFFMRSPILSPRKDNKKEESKEDKELYEDYQDNTLLLEDDEYKKEESKMKSKLESEAEDEEDVEEDSDSDYIYETSEEEEEEEEEEEGLENEDHVSDLTDVKLAEVKFDKSSRSSSVSGVSSERAVGKFI